MQSTKEINKLVKAYARKLRPYLRETMRKYGRSRSLEKAYYHGYLEALRQNGLLKDRHETNT